MQPTISTEQRGLCTRHREIACHLMSHEQVHVWVPMMLLHLCNADSPKASTHANIADSTLFAQSGRGIANLLVPTKAKQTRRDRMIVVQTDQHGCNSPRAV